jgi:hypothetical protein
LRKFIYGPGIDEPICLVEVAENNAVYYYHFDGLGYICVITGLLATFLMALIVVACTVGLKFG